MPGSTSNAYLRTLSMDSCVNFRLYWTKIIGRCLFQFMIILYQKSDQSQWRILSSRKGICLDLSRELMQSKDKSRQSSLSIIHTFKIIIISKCNRPNKVFHGGIPGSTRLSQWLLCFQRSMLMVCLASFFFFWFGALIGTLQLIQLFIMAGPGNLL